MTELTDLEICKRIAEIEKLNQAEATGQVLVSNGFSCARRYNPLTDDALCFQLMVKHTISVDFNTGNRTIAFMDAQKSTKSVTNTDSNKAICLAIIQANK